MEPGVKLNTQHTHELYCRLSEVAEWVTLRKLLNEIVFFGDCHGKNSSSSSFLGDPNNNDGKLMALKVGSLVLLLALTVVTAVLMYFVKNKVNITHRNMYSDTCIQAQIYMRIQYQLLCGSNRNTSISPSFRWSRWLDPMTMITSTLTSRTLNTI